MFIPGNALLKGALSDMIDVAPSGILPGILNGAKMGLFTNQPGLTQNTVLTDLTQPTYNGYALQSVGTFQGPFRNQDGSYSVVSGDCIFQMADALTPTTVYGWFLTDGHGGGTYLGGEKFDTPHALVTVDDAVALLANVQLPASGLQGGGVLL